MRRYLNAMNSSFTQKHILKLIILLLTQEALYNTEKKIAQYSDCFTSLCPQYN